MPVIICTNCKQPVTPRGGLCSHCKSAIPMDQIRYINNSVKLSKLLVEDGFHRSEMEIERDIRKIVDENFRLIKQYQVIKEDLLVPVQQPEPEKVRTKKLLMDQALILCKNVYTFVDGSIHYENTIRYWKKIFPVFSKNYFRELYDKLRLNQQGKIEIEDTVDTWVSLGLVRN